MTTVICILDNVKLENIPSELSLFGKGELCRLEKIKNPRRRAESATGLMCLKTALQRLELLKESRCFEILRDENGKPFFADAELPNINITHDGALSAAVVSDSARVGIDIEKSETLKGKTVTDPQKKLADRFFSAAEKERLLKSSYQADEFFRIWTEKEAYSKMCGKGLSKILAEREELENKNEETNFLCFEIIHRQERYILTLCSDKAENAEIIAPDVILTEIK